MRGVLVTRPLAEGRATAARLEAMGFTPVLAPLMQVTPRPLGRVPAHAAVLVTSGNALASLAGREGAMLLAVGEATARRARAAGFGAVLSAGGDAADLLRLARARLVPGGAVLLAAGQGQGQELAAGLREAGLRVHRRVAYAARPVRRLPPAAAAALQAGQLHAALFLSAETARTFVRLLPAALLPALAPVEALALGAAAARVLAPLPFRRLRVPLSPTLEELLALL